MAYKTCWKRRRNISEKKNSSDFKETRTHEFSCVYKQLLDEVEHDIMNYQSRGLLSLIHI